MSRNFVIIANGSYPVHPVPLNALNQADVLVACDGAAETLTANGICPDHVVGDLDSLNDDLKKQFADRLIHEEEQETNDLSKAFRFVCRTMKTEDQLIILGATGKREDHTLGNISLLADFSATHPNVRMITDTGIFFPVTQNGTFESIPGQQISIFNPSGETVRINGSGLKYPIDDLALARWWTATLNTALDDHFSISFTSGNGPLIIFAAYIS